MKQQNSPRHLKFMTSRWGVDRERERSIFCCGYRHMLWDQDTTWPAAYNSVRRGHNKKVFIYRISKYSP